MDKDRLNKLQSEIIKLHESVSRLKQLFPSKQNGFTLDGRLVGDIGEVIAEELFQIKLFGKLEHHYDALTTYEPKLKVQIKATFKEHLTYNHEPDYYIGIKLFENGDYKVIYNGPGKYIHDAFNHRKDIGKKLLLFPNFKLEELSMKIDDSERILLRKNKIV
jgi:hypothetical protein